jgi:hypothetical protein
MEFYSAIKKNEILSYITRLKRSKKARFPSYVDYRLKTNALVLLYMGHTLRGDCTQEG